MRKPRTKFLPCAGTWMIRNKGKKTCLSEALGPLPFPYPTLSLWDFVDCWALTLKPTAPNTDAKHERRPAPLHSTSHTSAYQLRACLCRF